MTTLPIIHMTLYKHGVGFFGRRAEFGGEAAKLSFRVEDMNDILKSLTTVDWGGGKVLGIDYATPQSREERLAGCSIQLEEERSLQDLLVGLRGRRVRLILDQEEQLVGALLGLDAVSDRQPLDSSLVSLLLDETAHVQTVSLARLQGVEILDPQGADDLRFFLDTALGQEDYRQVTIRLTPGDHDLAVNYIAPAPVWRVSYRLVVDEAAEEGPRALLLGWGIFDNKLEEDLENISLSLVAGMPISFIYDLYTPFMPERPVVEEEGRVAAAPVEFADAVPGQELFMLKEEKAFRGRTRAGAVPSPAPAAMPMDQEALAQAAPVAAEGAALGELFQYNIVTPVTVGRGQSAMVPIVSADLSYRKDLLYNGSKLPGHPVATLRLENGSGLTLERGPVTVMSEAEYLGEAILPFTADGGELVVPYAVELSVKVREKSGSRQEMHQLRVEGAFLYLEEWDVRWREYQINEKGGQPVTVLVEHFRTFYYDLFDTPDPAERTDEHFRFAVEVPAWGEATLRVQERRLMKRREGLEKQSLKNLQRYVKQGLMDAKVRDGIVEFLETLEKFADCEKALVKVEEERQKIYQAQQQIQGNMKALGTEGKEGKLRASYVDKLEGTEAQLQELAQRETALKDEIERLKVETESKIQALG